MKYSLMSHMIDKYLRVTKPSFIHMHMLEMLGYQGETPSVDEMFAFFQSHGLPLENGTMTFEDMVVFAKEHGFDGLDLMSFHMLVPPEEAREILKKHDFVLSSVNVIVPFAGAMSPEEMEGMLQMARSQIDDAITAGTKHIMVVPAVYNLPEGLTTEACVQNCIYGLKQLVPYGNARGVTVSTETLESSEVPYCTYGEMLRVLNGVENLKYTHDSGNPVVGLEDPMTLLEGFWDRVSYVHFKEYGYVDGPEGMTCRNGKKVNNVPYGQGLIDFRTHLVFLKRSGYQGYINLEGFMENEDRLQGVADALPYFRKMEESC